MYWPTRVDEPIESPLASMIEMERTAISAWLAAIEVLPMWETSVEKTAKDDMPSSHCAPIGALVRKKRTITSKLDEVAGIGPSKRTALLKKFGSVKKIGEATIEELAETSGVSTTLAAQIKASLATS